MHLSIAVAILNHYIIKVKIITSNQPSAMEHHGCPFRHYNQDNLKTLLSQTISTSEVVPKTSVTNNVNEIMKIVTDGHYQIACTRLFEMTHKDTGDKSVQDTIDHPNMWFELSYGNDGRAVSNKFSNKEKNAMDVDMKEESIELKEFKIEETNIDEEMVDVADN